LVWVGGQEVSFAGHSVCVGGHCVCVAGQRVCDGGHCVSVAGQTVGSTVPAAVTVCNGIDGPAFFIACSVASS
jgi:hypothetical protein